MTFALFKAVPVGVSLHHELITESIKEHLFVFHLFMFHGLIDEIIFQFQVVFRCKYVLERDRFGGVCSGVCIKETVSASFSLHTVSFHCQINLSPC